MEEKENQGFHRDWEDNPGNSSVDDYGLPKVDYGPLDKEDDDYEQRNAHEELNQKYYEYEENKSSRIWVILLIVFLLGGISFAVYWFQFRDNGNETITIQDSYQLPTPVVPDVVVETPVVEESVPAPEPFPTTGVLHTISAPSGSYYIVVGSFIDDDLAMDHSNRLNKDGMDTYLIHPVNNNKFYRLAVSNAGSWSEAAEKLDEMKNNFGQDIWVLKH